MASHRDWWSTLKPSERFANVQKIEAAAHPAALTAGAFTLEDEAYLSSTSREDYDAACALLASPPGLAGTSSGTAAEADAAVVPPKDIVDLPDGIDIGSYKNCRYVASGVTSDVYRSDTFALKVVTSSNGPPPHDARREAAVLARLRPPCVPLLATLRDDEQRLVLVFPYMPLTLDTVLRAGTPLSRPRLRHCFIDILTALVQLHGLGILHRDIKPSAVLLGGPDGPAYLADFGTVWHPELSPTADPPEPADRKILDVGTGPYRAPEALFGHQAYGPALDLWAVGAMLAECARPRPAPLFSSRAAHEDGNQLGLILSIFQTLGTPTPASWPEAAAFTTPPFAMYRVFPPRAWPEILPDVAADLRSIVAALIVYETGARWTAEQTLEAMQRLDDAESPATTVTFAAPDDST